MMNIGESLEHLFERESVSIHGYADLRNHQKELAESGGEIVEGYPLGISIGIALPSGIVDFLDRRMDRNVAAEYYFHAYRYVNDRLNAIASKTATLLESRGYRTLPIPAADWPDEANARATVSHKMIANLSGLGWIGKNCLLVTPEYGPRVRFVSLLTEAPLEASRKSLPEQCGNCMLCAEICPVKAIRGVNYRQGEERDVRFDFRKCQNYFREMEKDDTRKPICGMCLYICPYGRDKQPASIEASRVRG